MNDCPARKILEQLLAGTLDGPLEEATCRHVRICARCQAALDALSDDPELAEFRRHLTLTPIEMSRGSHM